MLQEPLGLKRNISFFEGIMFVVGFVIGTGIFLKPSIVLNNMGSTGGALAIWIVGGIITICAALSIAELASHITKTGGLYAYLTVLYGEKIGFLYGWVEAVIASPGAAGAIAIAFAVFSTFFIPMNDIQQKYLAVVMVTLIVIAQIISTRFGVWLQTISTIGKLIPLAAIILFGLMKGTAHDINFVAVAVPESQGVGAALLGVLWAYDGWISTCTLGSEMKNPEKDLPKAIITGVVFVMAVYVMFNIAIFNVLSGSAVLSAQKVGVDVAQKLFGEWGAIFITAGMMVSVFGALNAQMACGARISYAMGMNGMLPVGQSLAKIHPKLSTPINSLLFQGILAVIYILTGSFNSLTNMVVFILWIFFTTAVFGVFVIRRKVKPNNSLYQVPLYPLTPIVGIIGGGFLVIATVIESFSGVLMGLGLTLVGLGVYYLAGLNKPR